MAFRKPANPMKGNTAQRRVFPAGYDYSCPAPIAGWNARDPLAAMQPTDAVYLTNWFPIPSGLMTRPGSKLISTLPTGHTAEALIGYSAMDGTHKLFAFDNTGTWDVTSSNPAAASYTITNGQVNAVQMVNSGNSFLWCCNGADTPFTYNPTAGWAVTAITGLPTGAKVANACLFKSRICFTLENSLSFWYLGLEAIQGVATEFPLGQFFTKGGYLVGVADWSYESGGTGPGDYFVAVSSEGEALVYSGIDPSQASTFSLVGLFYVGRPTGNRPFIKLAGELAIITEQGIIPMSQAIQSAILDHSTFVSDRIRSVFSEYTSLYGNNYGWQGVLFPNETALIVNVPYAAGATPSSVQFVMNTQTRAWCQFSGWNASSFAEMGGLLYFASGGQIFQAWTGYDDNGAGIDCLAKAAFNYAGRPFTAKKVNLIRPIIEGNTDASYTIGIDTDFDDEIFAGALAVNGQNYAIWDQSNWDQAVWASSSIVTKNWASAPHNPGFAFALRLRILNKGVSLQWSATTFLLEDAGLVV